MAMVKRRTRQVPLKIKVTRKETIRLNLDQTGQVTIMGGTQDSDGVRDMLWVCERWYYYLSPDAATESLHVIEMWM
jgi:hypothetical protein